MKLGTHPRNIQSSPSLRLASRMIFSMDCLDPTLLMILDLITSTGLQTVVVTNPAAKDAQKWVGRVSDMCNEERHMDLK